jgi:hypothetical protein
MCALVVFVQPKLCVSFCSNGCSLVFGLFAFALLRKRFQVPEVKLQMFLLLWYKDEKINQIQSKSVSTGYVHHHILSTTGDDHNNQ